MRNVPTIMVKYGSWDIPDLEYFDSKNSFYGSRDDFRFKITVKDDSLIVYYWYEDVCFEKRSQDLSQNFPHEDKSLYEINELLTEKYNKFVGKE